MVENMQKNEGTTVNSQASGVAGEGGGRLYIGPHLSISDGFAALARDAISIDANTFQFFTRNPRGGQARALDEADLAAYRELAAGHGFGAPVAHAPYTLNPASDKASTRRFALETFLDDLARIQGIPGCLYNFHPGSHVGQGLEVGLGHVVRLLDEVLPAFPETPVLLETMAGKGSEIGGEFGQLRAIIDRVKHPENLFVTLDTCHVHDAGYPVETALEDVLAEFDRVIGLGRLRAIHLNDSKNPLGSHKDRHEVIGGGTLGLAAFAPILHHPALRSLPFILETPQPDLAGYAKEIALLRGL